MIPGTVFVMLDCMGLALALWTTCPQMGLPAPQTYVPVGSGYTSETLWGWWKKLTGTTHTDFGREQLCMQVTKTGTVALTDLEMLEARPERWCSKVVSHE